MAAIFIPLLVAVLLNGLGTFDSAPLPENELTQKGQSWPAPYINSHMLLGSERIGYGELLGPEDLAYEPKTGVVYTGCEDGWIRRFTLTDSAADTVVEKWVNTGGRPLGLAHGLHGEVIVADAVKGLLNISKDGAIELLTDEADGLKFKLTNAVDIGGDGTLYFTDSSYKYGLDNSLVDLLEGIPRGRFLSYDPSTRQTRVLLKDLYFANGVVVYDDRTFVIFCETSMMRCKKYYVQGPRKGSVDIFVENLPGMPDNIRYDGQGVYWIALFTDSYFMEMLQRFPFVRKLIAIVAMYVELPIFDKNAGAVAVDMEGKPIAQYYDVDASKLSTGIKIGEHLYFGSLVAPDVIRVSLTQPPASATSLAA